MMIDTTTMTAVAVEGALSIGGACAAHAGATRAGAARGSITRGAITLGSTAGGVLLARPAAHRWHAGR